MNFIQGMLKSNGLGAVEAVSTLASGNSLAESGQKLAKRALSLKFEKLLLESADAYVAGYSSNTMAMLGVAGISTGVGAATWGSLKALAHFNEQRDEEKQSDSIRAAGGAAGFVALAVFAAMFVIVTTTRRQRTLKAFTGTSMASQYAKWFTVSFVLSFILWRVMIPTDVFETHHVALFAAGFAGVILSLVNKFYFVFKLNDLEQKVFASLASAFDACKDVAAGTQTCDHKHAGFVRLFDKVSTVLQKRMEMIWGTLDYAEIAREISKSQKFDTIESLVG